MFTRGDSMERLSEKAEKIYSYLVDVLGQNEACPTVREICTNLQIKSTSTVHNYLKELEEKGYITKEKNLNRTIKLTVDRPKTAQVPLVGTVAAGLPILAIENVEGFLCVETSYNSKELFALVVKGDSMVDAGILSGDIIVARKTPMAYNGEIVVALIEDEATVKVFYKEKDHIRLQPCNDDYEPILTTNVSILGKVIKVVRNYE